MPPTGISRGTKSPEPAAERSALDEVNEIGMTLEMEQEAIREFWRTANEEWKDCIKDWKGGFQLGDSTLKNAEAEREKLICKLDNDHDRAGFRELQHKLLHQTFMKFAGTAIQEKTATLPSK